MKIFYFIFLISQLKLINTILSQNESDTDENTTDTSVDLDYLDLGVKIFQKLEADCYPEIHELFSNTVKYEKDKKYPWLIDSMGKGINDIGDETECLYSLQNTTFILVNFYKLDLYSLLENDQKLLDFLDIKNYTLGTCIMYKCREAYRRYLKLFAEFINFLATNKTSNDDLCEFFENNKINRTDKDNSFNTFRLDSMNWKIATFAIIFPYFIIKILCALIRTIALPKGYDKYIAEKLNKSNNNGDSINFNFDEKSNLSKKNKFNENLIDETTPNEYNPIFDFSEKLPKYIRALRIFDLLNDLHLLSSKRNRYFNDTGLDVIIFLRAIFIFLLVFSNTFSALVALPSEEIINSSFFKSGFNIFYRISNNSLNCLIFLEGVYTTYKLLCFITSEMFIYYASEEKLQTTKKRKLFKIFAKFLVLLLPKILTFFGIYHLFYYKIEDYGFLPKAKATYKYIMVDIFQQNIKCSGFSTIFTNLFSINVEDYNRCFEIIYFYINMIICIILFIIILYFFFLFANKIFEIIVLSLLFINFIFSSIYIKDDKVRGNKDLPFLYYHIIGQTHSTKIFYSFIGFYLLGFILGILLFNFDGLKSKINRLLYESNGIHLTKQSAIIAQDDLKEPLSDSSNSYEENEINASSDSSREYSFKIKFSENSPNYYKNFIMNYYPLKYLNKIVIKIAKVPISIKISIIIGGIILLIGLDFILLSYVMKEDSFKFNLDGVSKFFFLYEKHIFIIIFFIITFIMITFPKKGAFRSFTSSRLFISISRIGFILSFGSYALSYLSFIIFSIRVKLYVPTFMIISLGNFLVFYIESFLLCAVSELPLKMLIKKLIRINRKKENIIL